MNPIPPPTPCSTCSVPIWRDAGGKWRNADDRALHTCPTVTTTPAPAAEPRERGTICTACGLRSISALIVKRLDDNRGRCVNTAACNRRQAKEAKRA
jgi:hypothetical protein